jgi:class 3 adenylate cyclase
MDLVGYSTLLLDEQRQYMEQLTEIVRGTEQVRNAKEAGKLIRLPLGDGMALVFFDSPEAPMRCAIEISKKLKEYPQLKLRMGIHSGSVRGPGWESRIAKNGAANNWSQKPAPEAEKLASL